MKRGLCPSPLSVWIARSTGSFAVLLLGGALVGCGTESPGPGNPAGDASKAGSEAASDTALRGVFRRVFPERTAAASSAPLLLGTVRASDAPLPWEGTAEGGVRTREISGPDGSPVPATELLGEGKLKYVRGKVPAEAAGFNHVLVELAVSAVPNGPRPKPEEARLYLYKDGEKLMSALIQELQVHGDMQVATFRSPLLRGETLVPDEFAVAFLGTVPSAAVASVTFARAEDASFAPPLSVDRAADLPLVRIGTVSRRSFGVMTERPFEASFELREREEFRVHLGLTPSAVRSGERATFSIVAKGPKREMKAAILSSDPAGWETLVIDTRMVGVGSVDLSISIDSTIGDGMAIGAVAEPSVRRVPRPRDAADAARPETVVLVTSDTHRADHIGVGNDQGLVSTPHIDALAGRGVHFLDCVAPTNVTAPSHVSLMTGMHVRDTGILTNRDAMSAEAVTIASRFRAAGYETLAATSVFHLSQDMSGIGHGFDRVDAPIEDARPGTVAIETMNGWIREAGDAPLFCWVHVYDAHTPYSPPPAYDRKYWTAGDPFAGAPADVGDVKLPGWLRGLSDTDYPYAQYRAEVDFVDGMLGSLFDLPRVRAGITAFTADHGELFGEHGIWWSHSGLYPGIQQIPLVMAWPGAPAGTRVSAPVQLTDVGRTLAAAAGLEGPALPGRDLREVMADPPAPEPRFYLSAHHRIAAIEADGWFLTLTMIGHKSSAMAAPKPPGEVELFHLTVDPGYANDVVLEELDRARQLRTRLIQWLEAAPEERLNASSTSGDSESDVAMLATLGYGGERSVAGAAYWDPEAYDPNWKSNRWRIIFESEDMTPERAAQMLGR